ncbi:MAG TPA: type 4a pilus biogenesis protein PilO [Candidatus Paceibacterota bacterium]|nr:type 4a pilus biogenesis protein PilO [Candidatus Paceibacterota bacterium]
MNYLISLTLITISFFLSLFYTSPLLSDIDALGAERNSLSASLSESKGLFEVYRQKQAVYNNFTDTEKERINKVLPDSIDNVKLVIDIDDIASKYNMKIRNIDLKTEKVGEGEMTSNNPYGTATLRFTVSSNYTNFRSFLKDLEDSLRLVDISSLSFTASDKNTDEYNIELKTYWLKETI